MKNTRIDAYQHTRNKNCIYRRIGDTNIFQWDKYKRTENGILMAIEYDHKFKPFNDKT